MFILKLMKMLFTLSLLLCTFIGVRAQDIPKELLKTWMPIMTQDYKGDTIYQQGLNFLTFEQESGHFELPNQEFTFEVDQDSVIFYNQTFGRLPAKIIELQNDRLILFLDSSLVVTYIPLPNFENKAEQGDIDATISDNIWSFRFLLDDGEYFHLDIEFLDHLQDSSIVGYQYLSLAKTAKFKPSSVFDQATWYVDKHQNTFALHINEVFGTPFGLEKLIIKRIHKDKMSLVYWSDGEELTAEAYKWKKKSIHKQSNEIENLTRQAWRIQEEIIPPPIDTTDLMDLGYVMDDFLEYDEVYINDSTLIISQEDIDNHSLILKFEETGAYKIYRESRVLDEGKWSMQFNNTIVQLDSDNEERLSDGVLGGFIEIKELKRNKLIIYRSFATRLNHQEERNESLWEVYKPVR